MLEVVLELFFNPQIVALILHRLNLALDSVGHCVGLTELQLGLLLVILVVEGPLHALDAIVDKGLEIFMVQVEGLLVGCKFPLPLQTVELFQVEHLFDEEEHLYHPILAELPLAKVVVKFELS